jgi:drug/metabolite transporter (DMT)-like permease
MRPPALFGLILVVAGIATLLLGGTFTRTRDVLEVGDLKVTAQEKRPISPWIATGAILAGAVLLITSAGQRQLSIKR